MSKAAFIGEKIEPLAGSFDPSAMTRARRSTRTDHGDVYLARHWYEIECADGRRAVVYFDRQARAGAARWWLYTLEENA
ncbi:MAG: DUF6504 family protein [Candidatus Velthaea sp.]